MDPPLDWTSDLLSEVLVLKLNVLSYNIHKGFNWSNSAEILHDIKEAIRQVDAEVCCLQEILGEGRLKPLIHHFLKRGRKSSTESQLEFLADTIWKHYSYGKNAVFPDRHHGNAILSKHPIIEYKNIDLTLNRLERRGLLYCRIAIEDTGRYCHILNTHLNLLESGRLQQLEIILNFLRILPQDEPLILAGDFNDWTRRVSEELQKSSGLKEVHFPHREKVATFPSFFPLFYLDRIFYRNCQLTNMEVLDSEPWLDLSDHLPLFAQFEI